jgi:hypothetical protein
MYVAVLYTDNDTKMQQRERERKRERVGCVINTYKQGSP